jgi:hypothetical protein
MNNIFINIVVIYPILIQQHLAVLLILSELFNLISMIYNLSLENLTKIYYSYIQGSRLNYNLALIPASYINT